jgi:hypothetical protein
MGYHDWQQQLARTDPQLVRCWTEYTPLWDLYIEGKLQTTSWEDRQSAEKKYWTEIESKIWCSWARERTEM